MPLGDIFKSKQELENEQKKLQKKELRDATRSVDRVQADLDRQIKEVEAQIKVAASKNDTTLAKTLAKHLIKLRTEKTRAVGAKSKITSIASHASTIQTNNKLAQIMASTSSAMSKVNQQLQPDQLAKQLGQFQAESTKMEMKDGLMEDMFDELFEGESDEADSVMNQVLDELAIETSSKLSTIPSTSKATLQGSTTTATVKSDVEKVKNI